MQDDDVYKRIMEQRARMDLDRKTPWTNMDFKKRKRTGVPVKIWTPDQKRKMYLEERRKNRELNRKKNLEEKEKERLKAEERVRARMEMREKEAQDAANSDKGKVHQ